MVSALAPISPLFYAALSLVTYVIIVYLVRKIEYIYIYIYIYHADDILVQKEIH
jgi:hypothetical protein